MNKHEMINYIELPCHNIDASKQFFSQVFGWQFEDFGSEYSAFSKESAGLDGGFFKADLNSDATKGSALVIFYSLELEKTQQRIEENGGIINEAIFSFPGGRRFHFKDPSNNEFAVWSDK